jgi:hypothetical protein
MPKSKVCSIPVAFPDVLDTKLKKSKRGRFWQPFDSQPHSTARAVCFIFAFWVSREKFLRRASTLKLNISERSDRLTFSSERKKFHAWISYNGTYGKELVRPVPENSSNVKNPMPRPSHHAAFGPKKCPNVNNTNENHSSPTRIRLFNAKQTINA